MDLVTLQIVLKFICVISSGLYFGVCMHISKTYVPGLLNFKDLTKSVMSFQLFWGRCHEMPLSCITAGLCGIMVYLMDDDSSKFYLPWFGTGVAMLSMMLYQVLVINPYAINPLMNKSIKEKEIISLLKKYNKFHHLQTVTGAACFISFCYYLYCT